MVNKFLSKKIKEFKDRKELKKSNYGRDYGWFICYDEVVIGELVNCTWSDMFWDNYDLICIEESMRETLFSEDLWFSNVYKFKNKFYGKYAENAYSGFALGSLIKTKNVGMRMLYLTEL